MTNVQFAATGSKNFIVAHKALTDGDVKRHSRVTDLLHHSIDSSSIPR